MRRVKAPRRRCRVGVVGKYIEVKDSYKSLYEALAHGGHRPRGRGRGGVGGRRAHRARGRSPATWPGLDGILVPGGFGDRGIEGKIQAIRYAREQRVPYFGICLGMQCAVMNSSRVRGTEHSVSGSPLEKERTKIMKTIDAPKTGHRVVAEAEWVEARKALMEKEKDHMRVSDELARQRRELPWVKVEENYTFDTPAGKGDARRPVRGARAS